jgi:Arc/MetJ family transcription regulator
MGEAGQRPKVRLAKSSYLIHIDIRYDADTGWPMRTTVTIDDALYKKAIDVADPSMDKADLIREAIKVYVRVQSAKRLASLGAAAPEMQDIPRERTPPP